MRAICNLQQTIRVYNLHLHLYERCCPHVSDAVLATHLTQELRQNFPKSGGMDMESFPVAWSGLKETVANF